MMHHGKPDPDDQHDIEVADRVIEHGHRERPIIFSAEMVRAIVYDRKTQTRRVARMMEDEAANWCPYGKPGDRLWVRETFQVCNSCNTLNFAATVNQPKNCAGCDKWLENWVPPIFMPRKLSRITLEVVSVRVERVREMSNEDAQAEGIQVSMDEHSVNLFAELWDSINGKKHPWKMNPWVWVITFRRIKP